MNQFSLAGASKAWAGLLAVVGVRLIMHWTGFDLNALGVGDNFREVISYGIDGLVGLVTYVVIWLAPKNTQKVATITTTVTTDGDTPHPEAVVVSAPQSGLAPQALPSGAGVVSVTVKAPQKKPL